MLYQQYSLATSMVIADHAASPPPRLAAEKQQHQAVSNKMYTIDINSYKFCNLLPDYRRSEVHKR